MCLDKSAWEQLGRFRLACILRNILINKGKRGLFRVRVASWEGKVIILGENPAIVCCGWTKGKMFLCLTSYTFRGVVKKCQHEIMTKNCTPSINDGLSHQVKTNAGDVFFNRESTVRVLLAL